MTHNCRDLVETLQFFLTVLKSIASSSAIAFIVPPEKDVKLEIAST